MANLVIARDGALRGRDGKTAGAMETADTMEKQRTRWKNSGRDGKTAGAMKHSAYMLAEFTSTGGWKNRVLSEGEYLKAALQPITRSESLGIYIVFLCLFQLLTQSTPSILNLILQCSSGSGLHYWATSVLYYDNAYLTGQLRELRSC